MKKLFCKLPPLQWGAFLSALIAAVLQTAASVLDFDEGSNYFIPGTSLSTFAFVFALLSFGLGLLVVLTGKNNKPILAYPSKFRKLHLFPAIGFPMAFCGLLANLIPKCLKLWDRHTDGIAFLSELLAGKAILSFLCPPFLLCAIFYCVNWAFSKKSDSTSVAIAGLGTIIGSALLCAHVYFDMSIEMNAPVKMIVQCGLLSAMILFTTELRLPLGKPLPKLTLALSNLVISTASLGATSIPAAFLTGNLYNDRVDHLLYSIFLLLTIPVAIEHLLNAYAVPCDPDTERTDTL